MIRNRKAFCRELAEVHQLWLRDLSDRLSAVRSPDNSAWERAAAVRYLEEEFVPRFRRHTSAVNLAAEQLPSPDRTRVWVVTALIKLLRLQLTQLVHLAESGAAFAGVIMKLLRAFQCWCDEVNAMVEVLPDDAFGPELIHRFEELRKGAGAAESA
jgi:hypothetical protein